MKSRKQREKQLIHFFVSTFKESDGIIALGVFFFHQTNFDFLISKFDGTFYIIQRTLLSELRFKTTFHL